MSGIIWGYLYKNSEVKNRISYEMIDYMQEYKIDKYRRISYKNINFGCGLQYITDESLNEVLPYHDRKKKLIITADAIIDNRRELLEAFELKNSEISDLTDSEYILMAYSKWGEKCTEYLLGDYSFAIYDIEEDELYCATDHVGKRTFYYYDDYDIFAFCTVEKPLLPLVKCEEKYNERWLTDYFSLLGVIQNTECKETIYNEIYQLEPAHYLSINNINMITKCYWDPVNNSKPIVYKTENEYISEFLKIFSEVVNCRCRTRGQVGIRVSGGLDSSSVAVVAAQKLKKEGKKLHGYTSVPIPGFINNAKSYLIPDETHEVKELAKFCGNINANFYGFEHSNSFTNIDELIYILEQPYKIVENSTYIYEVTKVAAKNDCKVVLTGQYGNTTISFGDFLVHEKTLVSEGKLIKAIKEINSAGKTHNVSRKRLLKDVIKSFQSEKSVIKKELKKNPNYDRFENCPANRELIKKWNVNTRFDKEGYNMIASKCLTLNEIRHLRVNPEAFTQYRLFDTKLGLASGILNRDPTRDKRLIEFCLNIPSELFVKDGIDRYLIRKSMEGKLPDCIRMNLYKRGVQSADWIQRLIPIWEDIYKEIGEAIKDSEVLKYIDKDYVTSKYEEIEDLSIESDSYLIRMFLIIDIFYRYLLISRRGFKKSWLMEEKK